MEDLYHMQKSRRQKTKRVTINVKLLLGRSRTRQETNLRALKFSFASDSSKASLESPLQNFFTSAPKETHAPLPP